MNNARSKNDSVMKLIFLKSAYFTQSYKLRKFLISPLEGATERFFAIMLSVFSISGETENFSNKIFILKQRPRFYMHLRP